MVPKPTIIWKLKIIIKISLVAYIQERYRESDQFTAVLGWTLSVTPKQL